MAMTVPVPQAAAIMLPLLMVMDATGLQQLWRVSGPRAGAPPGAGRAPGHRGMGTLLFGRAAGQGRGGVVGALTLLFLAQRLLFPPHPGAPAAALGGAVCAVLAGFTSFVAHAGGPPINAYLLPMKMSPLVLSGTMAVFFAAINAARCCPMRPWA
jgi:hypothetical protein